MKRVFKIILTVVCWGIGFILLYETLYSFKGLDSWGLGFVFYTLPVGIISTLFLIEAILLTKDFVKKGSDKDLEQ